LVLWPAFTGDEWQLPTQVPVAERLLLGWRIVPEPVDEGPPLEVARLLVSAVARHATLTFASATRTAAGAKRPPSRWRLRDNFVWTTGTSVDDAVEGIFHADFFPWNLQGQVVILGPPDAPPTVDERYLQLQSEPALFAELKAAGAAGALLPGVDGAVIGLYFFDSSVSGALQRELVNLVRGGGGECVVARGEDFAAQLRA
jgi:hypothetical protein